MWRKIVVAPVLTLLALSGCGGGSDAETPGLPSTPVDVPQTTDGDAAADQAVADAALLRLEDFPVGWSETPSADDEFEGDLADARADFLGCVGAEGDQMLGFAEARATTGDFTSPEDDSISHTVAITDLEQARDFMNRFGADGVSECLTEAAGRVIEIGFSEDPDTPEDLSVGDVTVGRLNVEAAGDELLAYRVRIPVAVESLEVELFLDLVAVRTGRAVSGLTFEASVLPFTPADVDRYVGLAVERMSTALK